MTQASDLSSQTDLPQIFLAPFLNFQNFEAPASLEKGRQSSFRFQSFNLNPDATKWIQYTQTINFSNTEMVSRFKGERQSSQLLPRSHSSFRRSHSDFRQSQIPAQTVALIPCNLYYMENDLFLSIHQDKILIQILCFYERKTNQSKSTKNLLL